jgi:hypothetical protein
MACPSRLQHGPSSAAPAGPAPSPPPAGYYQGQDPAPGPVRQAVRKARHDDAEADSQSVRAPSRASRTASAFRRRPVSVTSARSRAIAPCDWARAASVCCRGFLAGLVDVPLQAEEFLSQCLDLLVLRCVSDPTCCRRRRSRPCPSSPRRLLSRPPGRLAAGLAAIHRAAMAALREAAVLYRGRL